MQNEVNVSADALARFTRELLPLQSSMSNIAQCCGSTIVTETGLNQQTGQPIDIPVDKYGRVSRTNLLGIYAGVDQGMDVLVKRVYTDEFEHMINSIEIRDENDGRLYSFAWGEA